MGWTLSGATGRTGAAPGAPRGLLVPSVVHGDAGQLLVISRWWTLVDHARMALRTLVHPRWWTLVGGMGRALVNAGRTLVRRRWPPAHQRNETRICWYRNPLRVFLVP